MLFAHSFLKKFIAHARLNIKFLIKKTRIGRVKLGHFSYTNDSNNYMNSNEVIDFIKNNKIFCFKTMFAGKEKIYGLTVLREYEIKNWYHAIDLQIDPKDYLNLNKEKLIEYLKKVHVYILCDKKPIISHINDCLHLDIYKNIGLDGLNKRADLIRDNENLLNKINIKFQN